VDASDGQLDVEQMLKQGEGCRRSIFFNEESENQLSLSQSANRSNLPTSALRGLRVILFEDVDIIFEEDSGFMGALALLARTSKCPIIFTSNSKTLLLKCTSTILTFSVLPFKVSRRCLDSEFLAIHAPVKYLHLKLAIRSKTSSATGYGTASP